MLLENRCLVPADLPTTWDMVMDIPRAAACVPGLQELIPDGENRFRATMRTKVGPMTLNLSGSLLLLEQDWGKAEARFQVEASDRRVGGSMKADMTMRLLPQAEGQTELLLVTNTAFMGKLGELGQPIIRRKASATLEEFARNLARQVDTPSR